jgi:hypothetical protein
MVWQIGAQRRICRGCELFTDTEGAYLMPKTLMLLCLSLFSVPLVAGCGDDGSSIEDSCKRGCAIAVTLKCPNDNAATCAADCKQGVDESVMAKPACKDKLTAALDCLSDRPATDWVCDDDGEANPKDDVCVTEKEAAGACLFGP